MINLKLVHGIINYLNGKKTFIGLALYFVLGGLLQIGVINQAVFDQFVLYTEAIIGIGLLHKAKKAL